ncbi:class I SAM-dependent methyltransferase [Streptomyces sp. NBC_00536]|uniref:class I SAM-dependent methyltransferase n=1 Tax=Streptomyces sp. NBC_00536 TaxID=2975769 RepID=UPI002E812CE2|nr:class I SAM-dependent methyltransferase [Streptomyces sp. NBC_00536]WUC83276.1 class I SAM-dependent methyltransferase [Streptomyces sp. NBC_00536]
MTGARAWYGERLADAYDRANPSTRHGLLPAAAWLTGGVPDGGTLLDVGCGTGRDLPVLARKGISVIGVDIALPMLRLARRHHDALLCADLTRLPVRDSVADAVWCVAAWVHVPHRDLPAAAAELSRVLRPGGHAVIGVQRGSGERVELDPYLGEVPRLMVRYAEGEVIAALDDAGLRALPFATDDAELRAWVTTLVVKPHGTA